MLGVGEGGIKHSGPTLPVFTPHVVLPPPAHAQSLPSWSTQGMLSCSTQVHISNLSPVLVNGFAFHSKTNRNKVWVCLAADLRVPHGAGAPGPAFHIPWISLLGWHTATRVFKPTSASLSDSAPPLVFPLLGTMIYLAIQDQNLGDTWLPMATSYV
jgi:hypothetical protein